MKRKNDEFVNKRNEADELKWLKEADELKCLEESFLWKLVKRVKNNESIRGSKVSAQVESVVYPMPLPSPASLPLQLLPELKATAEPSGSKSISMLVYFTKDFINCICLVDGSIGYIHKNSFLKHERDPGAGGPWGGFCKALRNRNIKCKARSNSAWIEIFDFAELKSHQSHVDFTKAYDKNSREKRIFAIVSEDSLNLSDDQFIWLEDNIDEFIKKARELNVDTHDGQSLAYNILKGPAHQSKLKGLLKEAALKASRKTEDNLQQGQPSGIELSHSSAFSQFASARMSPLATPVATPTPIFLTSFVSAGQASTGLPAPVSMPTPPIAIPTPVSLVPAVSVNQIPLAAVYPNYTSFFPSFWSRRSISQGQSMVSFYPQP